MSEILPKCNRCGASLPPDAPEGLCPRCLVAVNLATQTEITGEIGPHGTVVNKPPSAPPLPVEEVAKLFPQLEILECLGRGGMGAVYKARQPRLDRIVALKILSPEKQGEPKFAERFEREARALARLHHPNIVTVYDFGEAQGNFYLLMEFVDGLTLRQLFQTKKLSPAEALGIVPKICEALQYAHEQGIVHRDIKPENILLAKNGRVKIADFGIAKILGSDGGRANLTEEQAIGTPHYMSPEQIEKPQTVDHRADIYSLGVVFYEMLTGELPLGKFQPPSKKVQIDVRLDEIVLRALEKEPARRYQHASQVKTDVETVASSMTAAAGQTAPPPLSAAMVTNTSDQTILPAFLLAFFFGIFGAHRFYVGKRGTGLLQLFGCVACVFLLIGCLVPLIGAVFGILMFAVMTGLIVWATIDWILILCKAFTDGQGRRITNWIHPDPSAAKQTVRAFAGGYANPPMAPQQPDRFWRRFAVVIACVIMIPTAILTAIAILGMLAGIAIPNFVKGRNRAVELSAQSLQQAGIRHEAGEFRKDSSQSFPLNADGRFSIDNVKGRIEIHGWSSNTVVINAAIHGKTGESVDVVKININSDLDRAVVHTEQPSSATGFFWSWPWFKKNDASVDYTIQVPQHTRLADISSVNGRIVIDGVSGDIAASTVNGQMQIKNAARNLKLTTVNGGIKVNMSALGGEQSVSLNAVNGEIELALLEDAGAKFSVSTVNGRISSEFPSLKPKKESPVGNNLKGSLGNGGASVKISTVNGTVKILKGQGAQQNIADTPTSTPLTYSWRTDSPAANISSTNNSGASSVEKDSAVSAAQSWLKLVDAGNYSESWKQASAFFQGAVTEAAWENSMNTFRKPLGDVVSRKLKSAEPKTELPGAADGQYVVMQFETSFTNKKSAIETVTFVLEKDGSWKSAGYFIK